jgi:hypothetical protein
MPDDVVTFFKTHVNVLYTVTLTAGQEIQQIVAYYSCDF